MKYNIVFGIIGLQPWKYSGKEYDHRDGLDLYDYGARLYDPAASRWTSPDPLCEKYYHISPYAFCNNNPIRYIDRDGREAGDAFVSLDDAALNFARIYNYWSILPSRQRPYGAEYACTFYSFLNGKGDLRYSYYVTGPQNVASASINVMAKSRVPKTRRDSYTPVGLGHTHGGYCEGYLGNEFSPDDENGVESLRKGIPTVTSSYLGTTNGTFMKYYYNKKTGKWVTVTFKGDKYQLPSDAKDDTHGEYTVQSIEKSYNDMPWYEKLWNEINRYLEKREYTKKKR